MKRIMNSQVALEKAMSYCSKMERCKYDLNKKFYNWGISAEESQKIIATLEEQNFINEERYLESYIKGKFHLNKWGRVKIRYHLKLKNFAEELIDVAFDKYFDEENYKAIVQEQIERKNKSLNIDDDYLRKAKLIRFAQGRGYETELALFCVDSIFD